MAVVVFFSSPEGALGWRWMRWISLGGWYLPCKRAGRGRAKEGMKEGREDRTRNKDVLVCVLPFRFVLESPGSRALGWALLLSPCHRRRELCSLTHNILPPPYLFSLTRKWMGGWADEVSTETVWATTCRRRRKSCYTSASFSRPSFLQRAFGTGRASEGGEEKTRRGLTGSCKFAGRGWSDRKKMRQEKK